MQNRKYMIEISSPFKFLVMLMGISLLYLACKKSREFSDNGSLVVDRVSIQNENTIDSTITKAHLGTLIRIDGAGFSTLRAVYVNGVEIAINPGYVSAHHILFKIPMALPYGKQVANASVRNTIRLLTTDVEYSFPFIIQGSIPTITAVSNALPKVGDSFFIYGTNLRDVTKVVFPGSIELDKHELSTDDSSVIGCVVPEGGTQSVGAILVYSENGNAASNYYINYKKGVFIDHFLSDPVADADQKDCRKRPYNYGSNISGVLSELLPVSGGWTKNPTYYRQVPVRGADGIDLNFSGGFNFFSCAALYAALNDAPHDISLNTSCDSLALQFEYYIPNGWSSGFIRIEWVSGDAAWRYDFAPWTLGAGRTNAVKMRGWRTLTVPFNRFPALTGQETFGTFLTDLIGKQGSMMFMNQTYIDQGGNRYPASQQGKFLFAFGKFRIVPFYKQVIEDG